MTIEFSKVKTKDEEDILGHDSASDRFDDKASDPFGDADS